MDPIDDAYLQNGSRYNIAILRTENNKRTSYLKFDLTNVSGPIVRAELHMTVKSDPGHGEISVATGSHNNWTENNLSNANRPDRVEEIGLLDGSFQEDVAYIWDLMGSGFVDDEITLIVDHLSGNDVAFASSENSNQGARPYLVVEYADDSQNVVSSENRTLDKAQIVDIDHTPWPNPFNNQIKLKLHRELTYRSISIVDVKGLIISQFDLADIQSSDEISLQIDGAPGIYFLHVITDETSTIEKLIKQN